VNDVALSVAQAPDMKDRVKFIDNYAVAAPLFDLSFDMAHYLFPVGHALAENLLIELDQLPYQRMDEHRTLEVSVDSDAALATRTLVRSS